ncbi:MAG: autotransporter domain-containing protein, partial [Betaproteobacteria bacterium]|nr:autotransporter domain-containing protein [Betaproteobacteria bacterium]
ALVAGQSFTGGVLLEGGGLVIPDNTGLGATSSTLVFAGGTLSVADGLPASRNIAITTGGAFVSAGLNTSVTISSAIVGTGNFEKVGEGVLELAGTNTYDGATRVAAGMLRTDALAKIPNDDIHVAAEATLAFANTPHASLSGGITGSGLVMKSGDGDVTLSGSSSVNWQIANGHLESAGTSFAGNVAFADGDGNVDAALYFRNSGTLNYGGVLSGSGMVYKSGGGALVLSGDSSSCASCQLEVSAANTVYVDGMFGDSDSEVSVMGEFGGNGKAGGDVSVENAGTLLGGRMGDGRLTIGGDLLLKEGSRYHAPLDEGVKVEGDANIQETGMGAAVLVLNPLASVGTTREFTIMTISGALTGEFAAHTTVSDFPFMEITVTYTTNAVRVSIAGSSTSIPDMMENGGDGGDGNGGDGGDDGNGGDGGDDGNGGDGGDDGNGGDGGDDGSGNGGNNNIVQPPPSAGQPQNLANAMLVGALLDDIDAANMRNRLGALIRLLPNEPEAIQAAVGSLAAEAHASAKPALLSASAGLKDAVSAQMRAAFGSPRVQSTGDPRFSLGSRKWHHGGSADDQPVMWAKALASWGDHDGNDLYQNTEYEVAGALVGGDAIASAISSDLRLGFFTGLAKLKFTQKGNNVEGDDDSRNIGIYGGMKISNFLLLRSGVTHVWHDITTSRTAFNSAITVRAAYDARTLGAFGEVAFRFEIDQALFEPFLGVNYSQHLSDAYEENAGGTVMPVEKGKIYMGVAELGMRATREITQLPGATGKLMFSVNVPLKDPEVTVRQAIGSSRHVDIRGIPASGWGGNMEAGLDFRMQENMQVDISYAYSR